MRCYICRTTLKGFENRGKNVRLHVFPTSRPGILREWKKFAGIPQNNDVSRFMLCTKHFKEEDIISTPIKTRLLKTAIPCLLPPENSRKGTDSFASCRIDNVDEANMLTEDEDESDDDLIKDAVNHFQDVKEGIESREEASGCLEELQVLEDVRNQLCRVCGKREVSLQPIFETHEELDCGVTLPVKIEMYLPIKVGINDGLPANICFKCSEILCHWHELHVTCLSADSALRKIFCITREEVTSNFECKTMSDMNDRENDDSKRVVETDDNATLETDSTVPDPESSKNKVSFDEKINLKSEGKNSDSFHHNKPVNYMKPFLPSCSYCHEVFYYSDDCKNHVYECQNSPTLCDVCGEHVPQRKLLGKHKKIHIEKKSFICEKCAKCITSVRALQYHLKFVHERAKPPEYYCESCCKVMYTKFYYRTHMKKHASGEIKTAKFNFVAILKNKTSAVYLCPVCDEVFGDKLTLILHLTAQKLLNCPNCHNDFPNERKFILHRCSNGIAMTVPNQ